MNLLVWFFLALLSTAAYLALAIWGAGGFDAFFARPQFVALLVVTFALAAASLFTGGNLSAGKREDRGNRWVLAAFAVLGILLGFLPAYTDRIGFWTFGGDGLRWFGVFLYAAGGMLRLWPVFVLGGRFSGLVAIQPGHRLVTSGIYGVIRHPSYLGLLLAALGWVLTFRSGVGLILVALHLVPLVGRMQAEERLLHSEFGEEYEAYRARTSRLIPGIY